MLTKLRQNLGLVLLSIWLILFGFYQLFGATPSLFTALLALLAIAAGLIILAQVVTGPSTPVGGLGTPSQYIGFECLPLGSTRPTGARIKVMWPDPNNPGTRVARHYWDFNCDNLADLVRELDRIYNEFCQQGNVNSASATIAGTAVEPFRSTTTGTTGIRMHGPNGTFLFPCGHVPELINAVSQAFSGCCL